MVTTRVGNYDLPKYELISLTSAPRGTRSAWSPPAEQSRGRKLALRPSRIRKFIPVMPLPAVWRPPCAGSCQPGGPRRQGARRGRLSTRGRVISVLPRRHLCRPRRGACPSPVLVGLRVPPSRWTRSESRRQMSRRPGRGARLDPVVTLEGKGRCYLARNRAGGLGLQTSRLRPPPLWRLGAQHKGAAVGPRTGQLQNL